MNAKLELESTFSTDELGNAGSGIGLGLLAGGGFTFLFWDWLQLSLGMDVGAELSRVIDPVNHDIWIGGSGLYEPRLNLGVGF